MAVSLLGTLVARLALDPARSLTPPLYLLGLQEAGMLASAPGLIERSTNYPRLEAAVCSGPSGLSSSTNGWLSSAPRHLHARCASASKLSIGALTTPVNAGGAAGLRIGIEDSMD